MALRRRAAYIMVAAAVVVVSGTSGLGGVVLGLVAAVLAVGEIARSESKRFSFIWKNLSTRYRSILSRLYHVINRLRNRVQCGTFSTW